MPPVSPRATAQPNPEIARHIAVRHPLAAETTLYLVRHGRTSGNVAGILQGSTDVPLDEVGLRQAARIAARMREIDRIDTLLSSPLSRALVTARTIGAVIGHEPRVVPELVEMSFGALEGLTVARIEAEHPEIAVRMRDFADHDFTWPSGESRRGFHRRVLATFEAILADHPDQAVAVVAHGGVIGSFLAQMYGDSPNDWTAYPVANCSLTHVHVTPDHTVLHAQNDVLHLQEVDPIADRDRGEP